MAHKWAGWLRNPCGLGGLQRFKVGGHNQNWPTKGPGGSITIPAWGGANTAKRGKESEAAHKWAGWLHNPCRLGGPQRFRAGAKIGREPLVGQVATKPLPPRGSATLHRGGNNRKWPTSGPGGYATPAAWGVSNASKWGTQSELADKGAGWFHNSSRLGGRQHYKAGERIGTGPQMGRVAT